MRTKNRLDKINEEVANGEGISAPEKVLLLVLEEIKKRCYYAKPLSDEELVYLYSYNWDLVVDNYESQKENQVTSIINSRYIRRDLARIFHLDEDEISLFKEIPNENTKLHYGNLELLTENIDDMVFPENIFGDLIVNYVSNAKNVKMPRFIHGDWIMGSLESFSNFEFPLAFSAENVDLRSLKSIDQSFRMSVNGELDLRSLDPVKYANTIESFMVRGEIKTKEKQNTL